MRTMFDSITRRYDFLNHLLSFGQDFSWRRIASNISRGIDSKNYVLDLCTGTGDLATFISRRRKVHKVIGVDFSINMLRLAKQKTKHLKTSSTTFVAGDVLRLPFKEKSFSTVSCAFGIRNIYACRSIENSLKEIKRVIRRNGRLIILELTVPQTPIVKLFYLPYLKYVIPFVGRVIAGKSGAITYTHLRDSILDFPSPEATMGIMQLGGFCNIRFQRLTMGAVTLFCGRL
jgi:demethylmenaquinone methyltransferase/2-methoxy-6-polyprenyl-1,4-benzoquinol methylase